MTAANDLPDLSRTAAALEAYDCVEAEIDRIDSRTTAAEAARLLERIRKAGAAVGAAYGRDTADRNDLATCADHVRPGPSTPAPGSVPSFVRRMVSRWREQSEGRNP